MTLDVISTALRPAGLEIMGVTQTDDPDDDGIATAFVIGMGAAAWTAFKASDEFLDGTRDPLDRWSKRLIDEVARQSGLRAVYPSDGPPYPPVIRWALASGRFWQSPVGMMVHDQAGLMISIRGVLLSAKPWPDTAQTGPRPAHSPCMSCPDAPCRSACPVDALSRDTGYDVAACKAHLATTEGADCLSHGCRARRACPVSQRFGRSPEQSAFHMEAFFPR